MMLIYPKVTDSGSSSEKISRRNDSGGKINGVANQLLRLHGVDAIPIFGWGRLLKFHYTPEILFGCTILRN
jgi:hypothetical protein